MHSAENNLASWWQDSSLPTEALIQLLRTQLFGLRVLAALEAPPDVAFRKFCDCALDVSGHGCMRSPPRRRRARRGQRQRGCRRGSGGGREDGDGDGGGDPRPIFGAGRDLSWERLALTEQQADGYNLPRITKVDRRFKNGGGVHEAIETEALGLTKFVRRTSSSPAAYCPACHCIGRS